MEEGRINIVRTRKKEDSEERRKGRRGKKERKKEREKERKGRKMKPEEGRIVGRKRRGMKKKDGLNPLQSTALSSFHLYEAIVSGWVNRSVL